MKNTLSPGLSLGSFQLQWMFMPSLEVNSGSPHDRSALRIRRENANMACCLKW